MIILRDIPLVMPGERPENPLPELSAMSPARTMFALLPPAGSRGTGLALSLYTDVIAVFEEQSATEREPEFDSDLYGGVVGLLADYGGWSASFSLDYSRQDLHAPRINEGSPSDVVLPFPAADSTRRDVGVSLGGRLDMFARA